MMGEGRRRKQWKAEGGRVEDQRERIKKRGARRKKAEKKREKQGLSFVGSKGPG